MPRTIQVFRPTVFFAIGLLVSTGLAQSTLYVDDGASGANDGSSWCDAFVRLQDALASATNSAGVVSEVRVAAGAYYADRGSDQNLGDRGATFRLVSGVALRGGYAGCGTANPDTRDVAVYESLLSGDLLGNDGAGFTHYEDNSLQIVTYDDPNAQGVVLDGFTIAGGNADGEHSAAHDQGGAIHIRSGTTKCIPGGPTIRNCTIRDNRADHHGAINDHGLATVIENCTFRDNFSGEEGAGLLIHSGPTQVTNCLFINNVVDGEGGGAWAGHDGDPSCTAPSQPSFVNCTFGGNRAISGNGSFRGFGGGFFSEFNGPSLTNCVFEDNEATVQGAGMFAGETAAVVQGCTFRDNSSPGIPGMAGAGNGGGAWLGGESPLFGGAPRVLGSSFSGNFADFYGGGLSLERNAARVEQCTFTANNAGRGGGIRIAYGEPRVVNCTFDENLGQNYGAGLVVEGHGGRVFVWNSIFRGNNAFLGSGGALFVFDTEATFGNCLFVANKAQFSGGVLYSSTRGTSRFVNDTFYSNTIPTTGTGSLAAFDSFNHLSPSQASFQNCVLWNSTPQIWNMDSSVITMTHSDVQGGWPGAGNISADPRFADAHGPDNLVGTADDDLRLCAASVCIDTGSNAALPPDTCDVDGDGNTAEAVPLDLAFVARIGGTAADMGAYEGAYASDTCDAPFCLYGDVNASGQVNFIDISLIVQVFRNIPAPITFDDADILPCGGDGNVNFLDISAGVQTFQGSPPCFNICEW